MREESRILYIESDEHERRSLTELIRSNGFPVWAVATLAEARAALQTRQVCLLLIDIQKFSREDGHYNGLKLVNETAYAHIPKIIVMIDEDGRVRRNLRRNPSVVGYYFRADPQRLEKLLAVLASHIPQG